MSLQPTNDDSLPAIYDAALTDVADILDAARRASARSVNSIMTAAYWLVGHRIVEYEQGGEARAQYGAELIRRLSVDLTERYGRGFATRNLWRMRAFYLARPIVPTASSQFPSSATDIVPTASSQSMPPILQTLSGELGAIDATLSSVAAHFRLPWSAYVQLLSVRNDAAREFYESEAIAGGWTVRQLRRQIDTQFYERTALSHDKEAMLLRGRQPEAGDIISTSEAFKDPYLLEFLGLKDEYSESDLEEALIRHLEEFLMELGGDFCFVGRQRRLRVGDEWYRVDLLFYNRRLRCLVVIDLKLGRFTHADAGQMNMYLNYAREHWTLDGENPPVGLILCAHRDEDVARYALAGLDNTILPAEYRTVLPDEEILVAEINRAREMLRNRGETDENGQRIKERRLAYRPWPASASNGV